MQVAVPYLIGKSMTSKGPTWTDYAYNNGGISIIWVGGIFHLPDRCCNHLGSIEDMHNILFKRKMIN